MFLKYMGLYKCVIRPAAGREAHFDPSVGLALEAKSIQILLSNKWTVGPGGLGNGPPRSRRTGGERRERLRGRAPCAAVRQGPCHWQRGARPARPSARQAYIAMPAAVQRGVRRRTGDLFCAAVQPPDDPGRMIRAG